MPLCSVFMFSQRNRQVNGEEGGDGGGKVCLCGDLGCQGPPGIRSTSGCESFDESRGFFRFDELM